MVRCRGLFFISLFSTLVRAFRQFFGWVRVVPVPIPVPVPVPLFSFFGANPVHRVCVTRMDIHFVFLQVGDRLSCRRT
ncbi:hypothetical protein F5X96DRAFT_425323 [Biscogniauxia mediterranea]|nr:hypothetical protein F5X96DRAFT_425323 [Biscogniauxia mediterranea]